MERSCRAAKLFGSLAWAACFVLPLAAHSQAVPSVRRIQVLGDRNPIEIEIETSDQIVPDPQVLTNPDRLVIDFPNAVPAAQLHNQTLRSGDVKSVRVGLFASNHSGHEESGCRVLNDLAMLTRSGLHHTQAARRSLKSAPAARSQPRTRRRLRAQSW